ncbi:MAG: hypothetical protein OXG80_05695 [Chloroflexi bacterium]|nr:hypothetical protein [Chloroflexota bacterium]MCY3638574.1 hypothetical protein [Chloroflexota bacterium]MYC07316.1 hypothetical protein [Chloroflexota bacterium]
MLNVKYLLGLYQAIVAVAVFVFFSFSHVYRLVIPVEIGANAIWWWLDILILLGLLMALVVSFQRKRVLDQSESDGGLTREYFEANLLFWATIVAILWFIRSWIAFVLNLENDFAWWTEIDTLVILVLYPSGSYLMKQAKNED